MVMFVSCMWIAVLAQMMDLTVGNYYTLNMTSYMIENNITAPKMNHPVEMVVFTHEMNPEEVHQKGKGEQGYAEYLSALDAMKTICALTAGKQYIPDPNDRGRDRLGDIIPSMEMIRELEEECLNLKHPRRKKRNMIRPDIYTLWPRTINYAFNSEHSANGILRINQAIAAWEANTCLDFVQSATGDHLLFTAEPGEGCFSAIGPIGGAQQVQLEEDCHPESPGTAIHEIGHALGLFHTQSRFDRDQYVRVLLDNVIEDKQFNFLRSSSSVTTTFGLPYDYASIMHYSGTAFTINGEATIEPLDNRYSQTIAQNVELSYFDSKMINIAYCNEICTGPDLGCLHGGYADPKNCAACRCIAGLGGTTCNGVDVTSSAGCTPVSSVIDATGSEQCISPPATEDGLYYPVGSQCNWRIRTTAGDNIIYYVKVASRFGMYASSRGTCEHWMEVNDNVDLNGRGYRYCTERPTGTFTSTGNEIVVTFRSDYPAPQSSRVGFELCFTNGAGTTPPPPIAPVAGCDTTRWLYIHEGITFGGPEIAGVSTITECLDYCTASSSCFSFDINISEMKCYEHGTLTESAGTLAGVHQYRYACDGFPTFCEDRYYFVYDNKRAAGGTSTGTTTHAACIGTCHDTTACVSANWNSLTSVCETFTVAPDVATLTIDNSNTFYTKCVGETATCDTSYFAYYPNHLVYNGVEQPGVNTFDACVTACTASGTCVRFDFDDRNAKGCFLHSDFSMSGPHPLAQVHHHTRVCDGVPACSNDFWNLYKGKSMPGGVSAGTLASSFACVAACEGLSNCVAANWNSASSACTTFTDSIPDIASTATDVATSSFYARCSVSSHSTTPPTDPPTPEATTAASQTTAESDCFEDYFVYKEDTSVIDGSYTHIADGPEGCHTHCTAQSEPCYGFIFSRTESGNNCALLPTLTPRQFSFQGVTYYRAVPCGEAPCEPDTYHAYFRHQMDPALPSTDLTTTRLIDCVTSCKTRSCTAFDFDNTNNRCTLYTLATSPGAPVAEPTKNHYRVPDCFFRPVEECFCEYHGQSVVEDNDFTGSGSGSGSGSGGGGGGSTGAVDVDDQAACVALCETQGSSCVGVDYNGAASTCLVLTASEVCATFIPNSDIIHISRFDCDRTEICVMRCPVQDCYCDYTDLSVRGGTPMTSGDPLHNMITSFTQATCRDACNNYAQDICYAFDYNLDHNTCHLHLSATSCAAFVSTPTPNVNHGSRIDCGRPEACTEVCP